MKLFISIFFIAAFFCQVWAQTPSGDFKNDNQFWNEVQLTVWSNEKNELTLDGILRVGRDFSYPTDNRLGFFYAYKPSKYLTLTGGYLYRASFPTKNVRRFENRFIGSATFNFPAINKFKLADRSQFEYKSNNSRPNTYDYRNRLRIERALKLGETKITPFASAEAFYNESLKWYRSRFAVGVQKKLTKKLTGEIYYLRQNDGSSRPGNLNVLGTVLKIKL